MAQTPNLLPNPAPPRRFSRMNFESSQFSTTIYAPEPQAGQDCVQPHQSAAPGVADARRLRGARIGSVASNALLVSILSPFFALTRPAIQRILLAVVILDIPFQFGTHLFYDERQEQYGAMSGLGISSTTLALACLYACWFFRSLGARDTKERRPVHFSWALLIYLFIIVASVFVAQNTALAFFDFCLFLQSFLVYVYVANCVRSRRDVQFIVSVLLSGVVVESVLMVVLSFTGMPSTLWGLPTHIHLESGGHGGMLRVGGTVGAPNTAAAYLALVLSLAVGVLFSSLGRFCKLLAGLALGLGGAALIVTFSRGGWLALLVSLTLFCIVACRQRGLSLRVPIAVVLLLVLIYVPFHSVISARLFGNDQGSAESRIPLMNLAYRIFAANPVLGVGANNFSVAMGRYLTSEFRTDFLFAVHNKYLLVLCETGIGGLLAFLMFLWGALRRGWKCWQLRDSFLSPIALGLTAGLVGHLVHMNVDVFRGQPIQQLVWFIAGLFVAMHAIGATAPVPCAQG